MEEIGKDVVDLENGNTLGPLFILVFYPQLARSMAFEASLTASRPFFLKWFSSFNK